MKSFLASREYWAQAKSTDESPQQNDLIKTNENSASKKNLTTPVQTSMDKSLSYMNALIARRNKSNKTMRLRRAGGHDAESIFGLVNGLAAYENAADQVSVTASIYQRDGVKTDNPIFYTILVESCCDESEGGDNDSSVVGMGFFYIGYSLTRGKFLYLEDLFIEEAHRGDGCGKSIMYSLAEIALDLDCNSFIWQALDWNAPALDFYKSIGAEICNDLVTVRLDDEAIGKLSSPC